ncbi:MAG TPA: Obg family GTPase CgtA, partial [Candidatus Omnitrophota bacterium]|nr:Obg family GTPase CgtA [Candidatus Omnitrophota bacterium]
GGGGDVIFKADQGIQTLLDYRFKQHYESKRGGHASSKEKKGKTGADCILRVPTGTIIRDEKTGLLIKDLTAHGQSVLVAKGGRGGRGNAHRQTPTPPGLGDAITILLELKVIADVGIVGFPNAGKSTLISSISRVKSKVANYPFTTKQPILGIVQVEDFSHSAGLVTNFVMADLPGLIEGAHAGRGLGDRFLKHAERTKILLHLIDMSGSEGRDPLDDYEKINFELQSYSDELFFKNKIIVANKMDLETSAAHLKRFKRKYKKEKIFSISALEKKGLQTLICFIGELLCQESAIEKLKK